MTNLYQPPLIPGIGSSTGPMGGGSHAQTRNPFFSVGNQFLPRNLHDVIRWVRFITIQSPVTTEVLRKLATYPITDFIYSVKDEAVKEKYKALIKSFKLRTVLHDIGFQYFTVGNVFVSVYFPIHRSFKCPSCNTVHGATQATFLSFKNFTFSGKCPVCGNSHSFERLETKSLSIKDMNIIIWDPLNISVNHNPITGKSEYYYKIPNDIKRRIQQGDRLLIDTIPWEFVEAVQHNRDFQFEDDKLFHLKNIDMGMAVNGVSIPPLVSHFSLVFYQATLRKANESIATDFMAPLRVIFPQAQTANSDPVVAISMRNFTARMEEAFVKHKQDNNHILVAPVPIGYQAISGEGKTLLVNAEIAQAEESLLLSMGVSRELLSGSTNWTSSTVGLRMLRNTLDSYVGQVSDLIEWVMTKAAAYIGVPYSEVSLTPFQLTDDADLKAIMMALAQNGNISMTTVYEAMGRSYDDELDRMVDDAKKKARTEVRLQFEVEQSKFLEGVDINKESEKDDSYMEALNQSHQIAEQLINADPATTRAVMAQLKTTDYAKYLMTAKLLEEGRESQTAQMSSELQMQAQQQALGGDGGGGPGGSPGGGMPTGTDNADGSTVPGGPEEPPQDTLTGPLAAIGKSRSSSGGKESPSKDKKSSSDKKDKE